MCTCTFSSASLESKNVKYMHTYIFYEVKCIIPLKQTKIIFSTTIISELLVHYSISIFQPTPPPRQPIVDPSTLPTAYNDKVVQFLRQPGIQDILKEKYPPYATSSPLKDKVTRIISGGTDALDRVSNDLQLTMMLRFDFTFSGISIIC